MHDKRSHRFKRRYIGIGMLCIQSESFVCMLYFRALCLCVCMCVAICSNCKNKIGYLCTNVFVCQRFLVVWRANRPDQNRYMVCANLVGQAHRLIKNCIQVAPTITYTAVAALSVGRMQQWVCHDGETAKNMNRKKTNATKVDGIFNGKSSTFVLQTTIFFFGVHSNRRLHTLYVPLFTWGRASMRRPICERDTHIERALPVNIENFMHKTNTQHSVKRDRKKETKYVIWSVILYIVEQQQQHLVGHTSG